MQEKFSKDLNEYDHIDTNNLEPKRKKSDDGSKYKKPAKRRGGETIIITSFLGSRNGRWIRKMMCINV